MAKRRRHSEEHENAERWLLTYADMITLLMAFFIMLYAMSQLDIKKFDAMTGSVQAQLGGTGILKASMNATQGPEMRSGSPGIMPTLSGAPYQLKQKLEQQLRPIITGSGLKIEATDEGVTISLPATTLYFAAGSSEPTRPMLTALQRLATVLGRGRYEVKVTGHTCSLPVHNDHYQSNWELSADRARNVAFRLIRYGTISAKQCSYMGLADTQPVAGNDTEAHRARNRRVEIKIRPLAGQPPAARKSAPSAHQGTEPAPSQAPIDIRPHLDRPAAAADAGVRREENHGTPATPSR